MLQPVTGTTRKIICRFLCVSLLPTRAVQTKPGFNDTTGQQQQLTAAAMPAFLQRENYGALSRAGGFAGTVQLPGQPHTPCKLQSSCVTYSCHHTALTGTAQLPLNPALAQDASGCPCQPLAQESIHRDTKLLQNRLSTAGEAALIFSVLDTTEGAPARRTDLLIVGWRFCQSHTQPSEGKSNHCPGFEVIPQENPELLQV